MEKSLLHPQAIADGLTALTPAEQPQSVIDTGPKFMSPCINKLAEALAKAQAVMVPAKKDTINPYFDSAYADLKSVWDVIRKPLSDNGLSVAQLTGGTGEVVAITTVLLHTSGEWMQSVLKMKPGKTDPQGMGSCITYARRYSLSAMVGVAPEEDDGTASSPSTSPAAKAAAKKASAKAKPKAKEKTISERKSQMFAMLCEHFNKNPIADNSAADSAADFIIDCIGVPYDEIGTDQQLLDIWKTFQKVAHDL